MEDQARHSSQELHIEEYIIESTYMECTRKLLANLGALKSIFIETKKKEVLKLPPDVEYQLNNVTELFLINTKIEPLLMIISALNFTNLTTLNLRDSSYFGSK